MSKQGPPAERGDAPRPWLPTAAAAAIAAATLAVYSNSLRGAFVFDDLPAIVENPTLRQGSAIATVLSPPSNTTVAGRPLVNLSLAANYAWGGTDPWGYHAVNLAIHLSAALVLFGLARRTLALASATANSRAALPVAFIGALWWAVHPLQTESVTYLVQRAESLCSLLYLATLYCLLRGTQSTSAANSHASRGWYGACALACLLGMATKEVMATAPLVALAYDRVFLSGSFRKSWGDRGRLYAALAASWLLLAYLVLGTGGRSGSAGFHHRITWMDYAATQAGAVLGYLRLAVWPKTLVFDYGRQTVASFGEALPQMCVLAGLLCASLWVFRRWPAAGFLSAAFFVILAPSSSVVPIATQTIAEHRMYLPLAAVTVGLACGLFALARPPECGVRRAKHLALESPGLAGVAGSSHPAVPTTPLAERGFLAVTLALAALLGWQTWRRNNDYRTEASIWADTVAKVPTNPRAWVNLARAHYNQGESRLAIEELNKAVELDPDYADARVNRGIAYQAQGELYDARRDFDQAIFLEPEVAGHYFRRGVLNRLAGRSREAIADYWKAVELQPGLANAWFNLGNLYAGVKEEEAAIECYSRAIEAAPQFANAWKNRAALLGRLGEYARAIDDCTRAIALAPQDPDLYRNRSLFYGLTGRQAEARRDLQIVGELAAASGMRSRDRLPNSAGKVE